MINKNYYNIFVIVGFISCFLLGCLNRTSDFLSENKSGIYFYIQQNNNEFIGVVGVPKDNESLVVCVNKDKCELKDGEIIGADFIKELSEAKIYKIKDSINLSSKIEVIRDGDNRRKVMLAEASSNLSDVSIDDLQIIQLSKVRNANLGGYVLNDIVSYYMNGSACMSYTTYAASEKPTYAHEATHGLNACIRNNKNNTGKKANGFYLLEGKAAVVVEPSIRKSTVGSYVPSNLRNLDITNRFNTYVTGMSEWDDTPLYIFDEWMAYINGAKEAISLTKNNQLISNEHGLVHGAIEFMVYASALIKAASEKDSSFDSNTQLKALYKYLFKTTVSLYNQGKGNSRLVGSEAESYMSKFKSSDLYSFISKNFGDLGL